MAVNRMEAGKTQPLEAEKNHPKRLGLAAKVAIGLAFIAACNPVASTPRPTDGPTQSPDQTPSPVPTLVTPSPEATRSPVPTPDQTPSPDSTPIDPILEEFRDMARPRWQNPEGKTENYGLFSIQATSPGYHDYGFIFIKGDATKRLVYLGVTDTNGVDHYIPFEIPEVLPYMAVAKTNDLQGRTLIPADTYRMKNDEFLQRVSNGEYNGSLIETMQPANAAKTPAPPDSWFYKMIKANESSAEQLFNWLSGKGSKPDFVDNSNPTNPPIMLNMTEYVPQL